MVPLLFFALRRIDRCGRLRYNIATQNITWFICFFQKRCRAQHKSVLGDKGIAVKIRSNSHYRNLKVQAFIKSECLSSHGRAAMPTIKVSWANGGMYRQIRQGISFYCAFVKGAFILSFREKVIKGEHKK